jgi:hypothetical protein
MRTAACRASAIPRNYVPLGVVGDAECVASHGHNAWVSVSVRNVFTPATRHTSVSEAVSQGHAPGVAFVRAGVLHPLAVGGVHALLPGREDAENQGGANVVALVVEGEADEDVLGVGQVVAEDRLLAVEHVLDVPAANVNVRAGTASFSRLCRRFAHRSMLPVFSLLGFAIRAPRRAGRTWFVADRATSSSGFRT